MIYAASAWRSDAVATTLSVLLMISEEETVNVLHRKPGSQSTLTTAVNTLDRPVLSVESTLKVEIHRSTVSPWF